MPLSCFRFKINSAVVTLTYIVCCKNMTDVIIINADTMQSLYVDIRVWTNTS